MNYKCGKCGATIPVDDIKNVGGVQCKQCGFKVGYKERPTVKKVITAR